jgi:hypothetical protein
MTSLGTIKGLSLESCNLDKGCSLVLETQRILITLRCGFAYR